MIAITHFSRIAIAPIVGLFCLACSPALLAQAPAASSFEIPTLPKWIESYPEMAAARDAFNKKDGDGALSNIKDAVAKHKDLPPPEVLMGMMYASASNARGALASYDAAAREHPKDPEAFFLLGDIAFGQGRNTEAGLLFDKGGELLAAYQGDPTRKRTMQIRHLAGLASIAERYEEWDESIGLINRWIQLQPKSSQVYIRLARALFRSGKGKEAYAELAKANQIKKSLPAPPLFIAQFYVEQKDAAKATSWLNHAAEKFSTHLPTQVSLADWRWKEGNATDAKRHARDALKIDPTNSTALLLAGMTEHYDGNYAVAEQHFGDLVEKEPNNFAARNHLAMALAAQDEEFKWHKALKLAESNRREFPRSAEAAATLGWVQFRMDNFQEAAKNMQLASSSGRGTGNMGYFYAAFMAKNGKNDVAKNMLNQVFANKSLFVYRRAAENLYRQVSAAAPAGAAPAPTGPPILPGN